MRCLWQPIAWLAWVFVPPASWQTEAETQAVLQGGGYPHCEDGNSLEITSAEAIWCPLADEFDARCPGLADACTNTRLRGCDASGSGPCPLDGTPRGCGADGSEPCDERVPAQETFRTGGGEPPSTDEPESEGGDAGRREGRDLFDPEGAEAGREVTSEPELDERDSGAKEAPGLRPRRPVDRNFADRERRATAARTRHASDEPSRAGGGRADSRDGKANGGAGGRGGAGGASADESQAGDPAPSPSSPDAATPEIEVPAGLSTLAKVTLALLLALALFVLARAIRRNLGADSDAADEPAQEPSLDLDGTVDARTRAPTRVVETDLERLLRRAREAAARGDHEQAIADAFAALLRGLEGAGKIAVSPWRTHGDYLADLRADPPLRARVREIVREVEPVQFGATPADAHRFDRVLRAVESLLRPGTTLLAVLFLGAFVGLGCVVATRTHATGSRATGERPLDSGALVELLERSGVDIRPRREDLDRLGPTDKAIVLLEGLVLAPAEWDSLISWVEEGGTLVVATGVAVPRELGVTPEISTSRHVHLAGSTFWIPDGRFQVPTGTRLDLDAELAGPSAHTLLTRGPRAGSIEDEPSATDLVESYAVEIPRGGGHLVVFADGQLFTNASLGVADNAEYAVAFLGQYERVELVDELTGVGAENPLAGLLDSRFAPIFLQLFAFVGLLFLARGWPFARLRDPVVSRRRAFVDHVRALADRYARARASRHVAHHYARWSLDHCATAVGRRGSASLHQLAQALALRSGKDETEVMKLLLAAHDLATGGGADSPEDFQTVQQLASLLRQAGIRRSHR